MRRLAPLLVALALALTACGWTGSGVVVGKDHRSAYTTTIIPTGRGTMVPAYTPECWSLTVRDAHGEEHSGCVRADVWNEAEVGEPITLTEETKG